MIPDQTTTMQELPITQVLAEIKNHLSQANRLILQAPPGAGKTTLVPLALLDQHWLDGKQIIMLQPRRLAARNAASRMADLLGEKVGQTVGYQIRQDRCSSKQTRIMVVTEGILTRKLQTDAELKDIALVIFDEIHERNLQADLSLAFCLQSQEFFNEKLKILLMSATLDSHKLSNLLSLSNETVPIVTSHGQSFPVDIIFRADKAIHIDRWNLAQIVYQQTIDTLNHHQANILVFLPGVGEIKQLEKLLRANLTEQKITSVIIAPLYGDLSKTQQDQAISPPPSGQRKIVLATNIAETSLTIEGISVVIDSGLHKELRFNPASGMDSLHTTMISQSSATQRSGRAGRLRAGTCYRLWAASRHKKLPSHHSAEILSADLAAMMLEVAQWGVQNVQELRWLDQPPSAASAQARDLLLSLGAINAAAQITAHGKKILSLGLHPRLAHMIIKGQALNLAQSSCLLAALLTEKDIFRTSESRSADIVDRLFILQQIATHRVNPEQSIDKRQCKRVLQSAKEFYRRLNNHDNNADSSFIQSNKQTDNDMAGVLLAFAYPDRIAVLRNNKDRRYLLSSGKGAFFTRQDSLASEAYLVIASLHQQSNKAKAQKSEARIFSAAPISLTQIEHYFTDLIDEKDKLSWNPETQKVESVLRKKLGRIILSEKVNHSIDSTASQALLLRGIKSLGLKCLPWSKQALQFKQRVQFIQYQQQHNSSIKKQLAHIELPDFSDEFLLNKLDLWLSPHLHNKNSIKQLQTLDLSAILNSCFSWQQMQSLNELAPEKIKVPGGSNIAIDYSNPEAPVLAVRLQELFGLQQTPAIIRGHFPLLLHLLSPASRPMQVTRDLASFWENTYNDVKKELRGKYKKHYWPDDPLQAQATNRAKPKKF